jgi:stringent starvation protein B
MLDLSSQKPFIIKGYYEWFLHNKLEVNWVVSNFENTMSIIPISLVDGSEKVVLNMNPKNILNFEFIDGLYFRFHYNTSGEWELVYIPAELIESMYVEINGYKSYLILNEYKTDLSVYMEENNEDLKHLRIIK